MGTGSSNTGNSGNSSTSSPGLSRGLLSGVGSDGVSLSLVLGHGLVDLLHDIKPDGGSEDGREGKGAGSLCKKEVQKLSFLHVG